MDVTDVTRFVLFGLAQLCGLTGLFVLISVLSDMGGIDWSKSTNVHGFLMLFSMVYLQGLAVSGFRVLSFVERSIVKMVHAGIHFCVLILTCVGLAAALKNTTTYSIHGVLGLMVFSLFAIQWLVGFGSFLFPKLDDDKRALLMPCHRVGGIIIFSLAVINAVLGISAYSSFANFLSASNVNDKFITAGLFTLFYGLFTVLFVALKVFKQDR